MAVTAVLHSPSSGGRQQRALVVDDVWGLLLLPGSPLVQSVFSRVECLSVAACACVVCLSPCGSGLRAIQSMLVDAYHSVRKCKNRMGIHIDIKTVLTFPDRVESCTMYECCLYDCCALGTWSSSVIPCSEQQVLGRGLGLRPTCYTAEAYGLHSSTTPGTRFARSAMILWSCGLLLSGVALSSGMMYYAYDTRESSPHLLL